MIAAAIIRRQIQTRRSICLLKSATARFKAVDRPMIARNSRMTGTMAIRIEMSLNMPWPRSPRRAVNLCHAHTVPVELRRVDGACGRSEIRLVGVRDVLVSFEAENVFRTDGLLPIRAVAQIND